MTAGAILASGRVVVVRLRCAFFIAGSLDFGSGLGLMGVGFGGALVPLFKELPGSSCQRDAEQPSVRIGGSEGNSDAGRGFADAGGNLQEMQPDGNSAGASLCPAGMASPHAEDEPVGGDVQHEVHLVDQLDGYRFPLFASRWAICPDLASVLRGSSWAAMRS
jgi:hypothetical protein